jgi:nicotinamide mononucleotide transporter
MNHLLVIEWTAVLFNISYVVLAWYQKKSCWIFGAIGSALSVYYFQSPEVKLYAESFLYAFYVAVAIYGWFMWGKPDPRKVTELKLKDHLMIIVSGFVLAWLISLLTGAYTDAAKPFADSLSTVFGVLATFLTIRKVLSNWIYWVIIDLFSVWLYVTKEADIYAIQMFVFAILALVGYVQWKKDISHSVTIETLDDDLL